MNSDSDRKRRRLIGIGFVLAFALSTATIIYTGLKVRAPARSGPAREAPEMQAPSAQQPEPAPGAEDSDEDPPAALPR